MRVAIIAAITVGIMIALVIGTMSYQTEYDQNCTADNGKVTGFLRCTITYEDFTEFEITGIEYVVHPDEPLLVSVQKIGYDMCDSWEAKIVNVLDDSIVWERDYSTSCVVLDPPKQQKFEYKISNENRPIIISNIGNYVFEITIGEIHLEKEFIVRNNTSGATLDRIVYPDSDSKEIRCGSEGVPYIPENWQTQMHPSDEDWETLGRHLMTQEFYKELQNRNIVFEPACFGVHTGGVEQSYPPRLSMCSVVTASNGTDIYLEGMVTEFDVIYFDIDNKIPYPCDDNHGGCLCGIK